ncbi:MAG: Ppx/GppA family phosphatase [Bifidobacteriaceae bacterium]|jgi:exopolyphosphatase/guanosine-5'-triphosphate,3'-diphosphate pyrophosphatase|nr:Ppx/GppA family phosphatase [Bifidobacteriaceae bacterium]
MMAEIVRTAGIDCGTNSLRLLIADVDLATKRLTDVSRQMDVVRLGQGVDRSGWFAAEALTRTLEATRHYAQLCTEAGVVHLRFVATSATRDAANRNVFLDGVRRALGIEPEVIDGLEEAHLSFCGALSGLKNPSDGPCLCVDLGGGSTELVLGTGRAEFAYSMDVGCVRLTERHLKSDPPTPAELRAAIEDVDRLLEDASRHVPMSRATMLIGLGGSITTITAHALGLERYQPEVIDGTRLALDRMLRACQELWQATRAARSRLGYMHPGRVDVIGAGALVWSRVLEAARRQTAAVGQALKTVVTSEHDILDGIALSALDRPAWPARRTA